MESAIEFLRSLYNPEKLIELIRSGGYVVLAAIVFAETGLFIGFFLPGDSLLFTAGLVAAQGFFNLGYLMNEARSPLEKAEFSWRMRTS